jgi:hypothetical protein
MVAQGDASRPRTYGFGFVRFEAHPIQPRNLDSDVADRVILCRGVQQPAGQNAEFLG